VEILDSTDITNRDVRTFINRCIAKITSGGSINKVSHQESLDGLILGDTTTTVIASDGDGVTTSLLVTSIVTSLESHSVGMHIKTTRGRRSGINVLVDLYIKTFLASLATD
jgi:hypothetical protein